MDISDASHVQIACLDMSKAFDRMDMNLSVSTLLDKGKIPVMIRLIDNYLTGRCQSVKVANHKSTFTPIQVGTSQGTVM